MLLYGLEDGLQFAWDVQVLMVFVCPAPNISTLLSPNSSPKQSSLDLDAEFSSNSLKSDCLGFIFIDNRQVQAFIICLGMFIIFIQIFLSSSPRNCHILRVQFYHFVNGASAFSQIWAENLLPLLWTCLTKSSYLNMGGVVVVVWKPDFWFLW